MAWRLAHEGRVLAIPLLLLRQSVVGLRFVSLNCRGHYSERMSSSTTEQFAPLDEGSAADRKMTLRKQIRSDLSHISSEALSTESRMVWDRLFELEEYKEARSIGVFLSMPKGEILTDELLQDAARRNKVMYVPQVGKNFEQSEMELIRIDARVDPTANQDPASFHTLWPKNKWGIPEPPLGMLRQVASPGDLDLIVVPGLAFDHRGNRLGQGKGYYDRFIARMREPNVKQPYLVAVGLQCQLLESNVILPTNEYDQIMDMILLPEQTIVISKR